MSEEIKRGNIYLHKETKKQFVVLSVSSEPNIVLVCSKSKADSEIRAQHINRTPKQIFERFELLGFERLTGALPWAAALR